MERNRPLVQRLAGVGYSLSEVARRVEISRSAVSKIVGGKYDLRSPRAKKSRRQVVGCIAALLEVEVAEIDAVVPQDTASDGGSRPLDRRTIQGRRAEAERRATEEGRRLEDAPRKDRHALAS